MMVESQTRIKTSDTNIGLALTFILQKLKTIAHVYVVHCIIVCVHLMYKRKSAGFL